MQKKVIRDSPKVIISYSIEHLEKTDKVKFFYALKGRNGKEGFLPKNNIEQLGRAVLLVPSESEIPTTQFLKSWGCNYNKKNIILIGGK